MLHSFFQLFFGVKTVLLRFMGGYKKTNWFSLLSNTSGCVPSLKESIFYCTMRSIKIAKTPIWNYVKLPWNGELDRFSSSKYYRCNKTIISIMKRTLEYKLLIIKKLCFLNKWNLEFMFLPLFCGEKNLMTNSQHL